MELKPTRNDLEENIQINLTIENIFDKLILSYNEYFITFE